MIVTIFVLGGLNEMATAGIVQEKKKKKKIKGKSNWVAIVCSSSGSSSIIAIRIYSIN